MKIRFIKSYNLIFFMIALLSFCLVIFKLSPAVPVRADSKEPIKLSNSMCVCYLAKPDSDYHGIADLKYNTFIFKLTTPLDAGSYSFEIQSKVNLNNASDNDGYYFAARGVGGSGKPFNTEQTSSVFLDIDSSFQYFQVVAPHYSKVYDDALIEYYKLHIYNSKVDVYAELLYEIEPEDKISNPINHDFNIEKYSSINEILVEETKTYTIIFKGLNDNGNYYDLKTFSYQIDYAGTFISDLTLEEMYNQATALCQSYTSNNQWYDFKGWDIPLENITNLKQNLVIKPIYEERTSKTFEISFFGMYNEQLCQTFYVTLYSNGQIDNTAVTYENMFNIATENAKVLDNTTQHGNYYNYYFKNFSITAEELEDEILNSESGKSININANYEFLLRDNKVKIYDKDLNSFEEIVVVSGTLFNELNLVPKDIYLYNFVSYKSFVWDPATNKPNNVHWVSENYMIVSDLNIYPEYEYIGVEVSIITKRVNDYFGGNNDYHSFEPKALFRKTIEKGESISMPLPIYYYNFTPKFWTLEFDEINDYETGWANRIDDLSLKSYTISEDYDSNKLTIYLVYRYENGGIINPVPPSDIGGIENDVNSDFNNEQNTIVVGDNTIKLPFNKYWLLLIPGAVLVIAICIVVIILIKRRKKWKNN